MVLLQLVLASKTESSESRRLLLLVSCYWPVTCNQIEVLNGILLFTIYIVKLLSSRFGQRLNETQDWLVGHFRVPPGLCIKSRLNAQSLIWKWFFILMQIKFIFTISLCTWPPFESEGFWNSEVGYFARESALTFAYSTDQSHLPKNGRESLKLVSWWVLMSRTRIPFPTFRLAKQDYLTKRFFSTGATQKVLCH